MKKSWKAVCPLAAVIFLAASGSYPEVKDTGPDPKPDARGARLEQSLAGNGPVRHKVESSQAVLAYLRHPGRATLKAALETCLSSRKNIPNDLFNDFLIAFCHHEQGDSAGEERTLSRYPIELKNTYWYVFYENRSELADALYFLPAVLCKRLRESGSARRFLPPGSKCPSFGGPMTREEYRSGNRTVERLVCPRCDGMLRLYDETFMGDILFRVKNRNPMLPVLRQVAHDLSDKFGSDGAGGVSKLLSVFDVKEGQVIADIGSGIGYLTFRLADRVGPKGKVYAEDIDDNALKVIRYCVKKGGIGNIEPVLGSPTDIKIPPDTLDMAVMSRVYRDILLYLDDTPEARESFLDSFFAGIHKALKKDGVLVFSEGMDPALGLSSGQMFQALGKRHFRLIADRSNYRGLILLFGKAEAQGL